VLSTRARLESAELLAATKSFGWPLAPALAWLFAVEAIAKIITIKANMNLFIRFYPFVCRAIS